MKQSNVSSLQVANAAWNAAIDQALRTIDTRLLTATGACRDLLQELRSDVALLVRSEQTGPNPESIH